MQLEGCPNERDCKHGHKIGKCPHCDLEQAEAENHELRAETERLQRLINLKDDAMAVVYGEVTSGAWSPSPAIKRVIGKGYGAEEIKAGLARGENPFLAGTDEAGWWEQLADLKSAYELSVMDMSPCMGCGRVVMCVPDGMPMCKDCAGEK